MSTTERLSAVTPEPLFDIATGFMAAKHLFVANEVGLFEQLAAGPATLDELAQRTGIATERVRILADAMCALGLVERQGDRYQNGPVAAAFLTGAGPADLRPFLRFWNHLSYPMWTKFEDAVRTGQGQGTMELSGDLQRIFSEGVEAIQAIPSQALPGAYDFGLHRRVLDLGGGTGSWLLALLQRYPSLEGTLFDLPNAATIARQRLAAAAPGQRAQVVPGDFFEDPIPGGHDVVLIANVIHLFSRGRNLELLRRTRAHVPAGARLLLADFWTDPTHTQPLFAALMAGEFLVITGEGAVYSEEDVRDWLGETGWRLLERRPLAGPASLIVAEAAGG
jgi:SAM-dependent methyltransferase